MIVALLVVTLYNYLPNFQDYMAHHFLGRRYNCQNYQGNLYLHIPEQRQYKLTHQHHNNYRNC